MGCLCCVGATFTWEPLSQNQARLTFQRAARGNRLRLCSGGGFAHVVWLRGVYYRLQWQYTWKFPSPAPAIEAASGRQGMMERCLSENQRGILP
jgi:hypothetical protein